MQAGAVPTRLREAFRSRKPQDQSGCCARPVRRQECCTRDKPEYQSLPAPFSSCREELLPEPAARRKKRSTEQRTSRAGENDCALRCLSSCLMPSGARTAKRSKRSEAAESSFAVSDVQTKADRSW